MSALNNIHLFKCYNVNVIFCPESYSIIKTNELTYKLIADYLKGFNIKELSNKYSINSYDTNLLIDKIKIFIDNSINKYDEIYPEKLENSYLTKLVLNISGVCNLRCLYCYANGGSYSNNSGLMSKEKAIQALKAFYRHYKYIKTILFFGGEPFLNAGVLKECCDFIYRSFENREINKMPEFAVVTNCTILNDEIIDLIKRYNVRICVSIDGFENIHNKLRVYKNGKGTYSTVINNIKILKDNIPNELISNKVTYTNIHKTLGISIRDIMSFMKYDVGISQGTIVPVAFNKIFSLDSDIEFYREYIDAIFQDFGTGILNLEDPIVYLIDCLSKRISCEYILPNG